MADAGEVKLHESWREPLAGEFDSPYMAALREFLVAEKAAGGGYRAIAFGESNMVGWPEPMLSQALGRPTLNAAAGGGTQTLLWQFTVADFSRLRPDIAVLMLGGNNLGFSACEVYWGIRADVQAVRQHFPQARVIVMSMMPGGDHFAGREDKKAAVNAELRANAGRDYDYLDIYGPLSAACDHRESCSLFRPDNIHYTREGYEFLSDVLRNFVARSMPR